MHQCHAIAYVSETSSPSILKNFTHRISPINVCQGRHPAADQLVASCQAQRNGPHSCVSSAVRLIFPCVDSCGPSSSSSPLEDEELVFDDVDDDDDDDDGDDDDDDVLVPFFEGQGGGAAGSSSIMKSSSMGATGEPGLGLGEVTDYEG